MPRTLAPNDLSRLVESDPNLQLIDVRSPGEFASRHIPGSVNVPLDRFSASAVDTTADSPVVLVCQSGSRASDAQSKLSDEDAFVLTGGLGAWQAGGGAVNEGEVQRWAMDRQVRLVAGSLVLLGVLGSVVLPGAVWLAAAVGAGLVFSAVTNTCTMAQVLGKLPYNKAAGVSCSL